jgi:hypothetical protein
MHFDTRGLQISTASAKAAAAFDHLVTGYLTQRADTPDRLKAVLEADPDFALAHCMKGYFAMLAFKQVTVPAGVQAARTPQSLAALPWSVSLVAGRFRRSASSAGVKPLAGWRWGAL